MIYTLPKVQNIIQELDTLITKIQWLEEKQCFQVSNYNSFICIDFNDEICQTKECAADLSNNCEGCKEVILMSYVLLPDIPSQDVESYDLNELPGLIPFSLYETPINFLHFPQSSLVLRRNKPHERLDVK